MNFEVIITPGFLKSLKGLAKRHRSLKDDVGVFMNSLKTNPMQGVELAPGIRKIRLSITSKGKGKTGGARVITYTVIASEENGSVYLLEIYDKTDYSSVDIQVIKSVIERLGL